MKFCVTIERTGVVFVEADTESDAIDIANHQCTDTICWSDDWEATDCIEDDSALDDMYISEKAFE